MRIPNKLVCWSSVFFLFRINQIYPDEIVFKIYLRQMFDLL